MSNELFAGIVFIYALIAFPFIVISGLYEECDDEEINSMAEHGS